MEAVLKYNGPRIEGLSFKVGVLRRVVLIVAAR